VNRESFSFHFKVLFDDAISHSKAIMLRRLLTLLRFKNLKKKKKLQGIWTAGRFECLEMFGVPKEVRTRPLAEKNSETIPLKINRPLKCNTEVHLEERGHEGMDWIKLANYIDQRLTLFNRLVGVRISHFSGIAEQRYSSQESCLIELSI